MQPIESEYKIGKNITCECPFGNTGSYVSTCELVTGSIPRFSQGTVCEPMTCKNPKPIANGVISVESTSHVYSGEKIRIGDSIIYTCKPNFELFFSGTSNKASLNGCARQCFLPRTGKTHNWLTEQATLDPLVCECRPKPCDRHSLPAGLSYAVDAENGYNHDIVYHREIKLACESGNSVQTVQCDELGQWSRPKECYKFGCMNPRAQRTESGQDVFPHTYLDLDRVILQRRNVDSESESVVFESLKNVNSSSNFGLKWAHIVPNSIGKRPIGGSFEIGDKMEFTCKRGFQPYFNAKRAMSSGKWTANVGSTYIATCEDGVWSSDYICSMG